ncbi:HAD family hydrolase [Treponema sp. J25]|uniref:HAD family hydrolase n=1 Tax=Treponema sp. J25 TaxID=2094121 RepID=UPI001048C92F|nr:HAD family hydrolase [Treponema sp. J25]TCW62337.1 HAD family hydrolase [Treponema sp. J25]
MEHHTSLQAVAFDLDGTLYPNGALYVRLIPFITRHFRLLQAMGKAREALRQRGKVDRFYETQAQLMASYLEEEPQKVYERTERLIYRGWEPLFKHIRPFPYVRETLVAFKKGGLKLGLLSDFPPVQKLQYLGLYDYFDVILCSEEVGALKPDPFPFQILAERLGCSPQQILYVGNSVAYDVRGAQRAGFSSALIDRRWWGFSRSCGAQFIFRDYRQLRSYVLR